MATTADIQVSEGSGKSIATYSVTEDAETKQLQRIVQADSAGVEKGTVANPQEIQTVPLGTIFNGKTNVTTAGTRVTLAASQVVTSLTIKALSTNTGIIYVGNASVASSNGYQLSAGESVSIDLANLNTVNLDCSVNGEGVTYIAIN